MTSDPDLRHYMLDVRTAEVDHEFRAAVERTLDAMVLRIERLQTTVPESLTDPTRLQEEPSCGKGALGHLFCPDDAPCQTLVGGAPDA